MSANDLNFIEVERNIKSLITENLKCFLERNLEGCRILKFIVIVHIGPRIGLTII
jgi:hypothetical protein